MFCRWCGEKIGDKKSCCPVCGKEQGALESGVGFWDLCDLKPEVVYLSTPEGAGAHREAATVAVSKRTNREISPTLEASEGIPGKNSSAGKPKTSSPVPSKGKSGEQTVRSGRTDSGKMRTKRKKNKGILIALGVVSFALLLSAAINMVMFRQLKKAGELSSDQREYAVQEQNRLTEELAAAEERMASLESVAEERMASLESVAEERIASLESEVEELNSALASATAEEQLENEETEKESEDQDAVAEDQRAVAEDQKAVAEDRRAAAEDQKAEPKDASGRMSERNVTSAETAVSNQE